MPMTLPSDPPDPQQPESPAPAPLSFFVIYDHPKDFPDAHIVVRRWEILRGVGVKATADVQFFSNVTLARRDLEDRDLFCLGRKPDEDDPVIVESWV